MMLLYPQIRRIEMNKRVTIVLFMDSEADNDELHKAIDKEANAMLGSENIPADDGMVYSITVEHFNES
jgi:hypothetical protein